MSGAEGAVPAPQMLFERVVMARGAADVDALVKYGALLQARAQNRSDSSMHACLSVLERFIQLKTNQRPHKGKGLVRGE